LGPSQRTGILPSAKSPKRDASVPTLAQMTEKAIDLLSRHEKGFFLQVEGGLSILP
jgi:alkaline phosphatase